MYFYSGDGLTGEGGSLAPPLRGSDQGTELSSADPWSSGTFGVEAIHPSMNIRIWADMRCQVGKKQPEKWSKSQQPVP